VRPQPGWASAGALGVASAAGFGACPLGVSGPAARGGCRSSGTDASSSSRVQMAAGRGRGAAARGGNILRCLVLRI